MVFVIPAMCLFRFAPVAASHSFMPPWKMRKQVADDGGIVRTCRSVKRARWANIVIAVV